MLKQKLIVLIYGKLSSDEKRAVEELHQYMLGDEKSRALNDGFLDFVETLLEWRMKVHNLQTA